ncbi:MAG: hypothetical protein AB2598_11465 [Candidatus Thiodiazotropha sp.]
MKLPSSTSMEMMIVEPVVSSVVSRTRRHSPDTIISSRRRETP